jgi:hypothetical protein
MKCRVKQFFGKTHRAYLWAYAAGAHEDIKAVVCDFCECRAGANAKAFLDKWRGSLVVDDFSGYKQLMGAAAGQITEVGCWAHARRKFHDLHQASQSQMAEQAIQQIAHIYAVERQVKGLGSQERLRIRQEKSQLECRTAGVSIESTLTRYVPQKFFRFSDGFQKLSLTSTFKRLMSDTILLKNEAEQMLMLYF